MAGFLLYHKKTRPTGRAIAEGLGFSHGTDPNAIPADTDVVIRWGNAKRIAFQGRILNSGRSIMLAGDKLETLRKLQAEGIPCVQFATNFDDARWPEIWAARKRRGFGGKDICLLVTRDNGGTPLLVRDGGNTPTTQGEAELALAEAEFFTKWINNDREYRLHVANGEIIRYQRKYYVGDGPQLELRVQNHANGYVFKQPHNRLRSERFECATRAVAALGLDFGAVDLIVDNSTGRYGTATVLEVNTAASCSPKTRDAYVEAFRRELQ